MPSTVIKSYYYNEAAQTLTITFVTGKVYEYLNVAVDTFNDFKAAFSKGTFFNDYIKNKHDYKKIH